MRAVTIGPLKPGSLFNLHGMLVPRQWNKAAEHEIRRALSRNTSKLIS